MQFMVTVSPKSESLAAIREVMAAEQVHVAKLRQAGVVREVYASGPGRAWAVIEGGSADEVQRLLAGFPLYPHVDMAIEPLLGSSTAGSLPPREGLMLTYFMTVADVARSAEFYTRVLGGEIVRGGEPTVIRLANSVIVVNVGGGPTDDKPDVTLRPPANANEASSFINIRVADVRSCYAEWTHKGATFLTEPKDHSAEIRCYMRDPDGYLIEVGQSMGV